MRLIKFIDSNEQAIYINPEFVVGLTSTEKNVTIYLSGNDELTKVVLNATLAQVRSMLDKK